MYRFNVRIDECQVRSSHPYILFISTRSPERWVRGSQSKHGWPSSVGKGRVHDQVMFMAGTIWSMQRDWHGTVETTGFLWDLCIRYVKVKRRSESEGMSVIGLFPRTRVPMTSQSRRLRSYFFVSTNWRVFWESLLVPRVTLHFALQSNTCRLNTGRVSCLTQRTGCITTWSEEDALSGPDKSVAVSFFCTPLSGSHVLPKVYNIMRRVHACYTHLCSWIQNHTKNRYGTRSGNIYMETREQPVYLPLTVASALSAAFLASSSALF